MSSKPEDAELRAALVDRRQKRETWRAARAEYEAARKHVEALLEDFADGQGRLPFDPSAAKPKKPHGSGDQAGAKSDVG